jgi:hypothetical protein
MADPTAVGTVPWCWIWNHIINVTLLIAITDIAAAMA